MLDTVQAPDVNSLLANDDAAGHRGAFQRGRRDAQHRAERPEPEISREREAEAQAPTCLPMTDDPLNDPALAELVASRLIKAADHAWEIERPADFDGIEAVGRFMTLAQRIEAMVGESCLVEMWPQVRNATFHAELVLPSSVMAREGY